MLTRSRTRRRTPLYRNAEAALCPEAVDTNITPNFRSTLIEVASPSTSNQLGTRFELAAQTKRHKVGKLLLGWQSWTNSQQRA